MPNTAIEHLPVRRHVSPIQQLQLSPIPTIATLGCVPPRHPRAVLQLVECMLVRARRIDLASYGVHSLLLRYEVGCAFHFGRSFVVVELDVFHRLPHQRILRTFQLGNVNVHFWTAAIRADPFGGLAVYVSGVRIGVYRAVSKRTLPGGGLQCRRGEAASRCAARGGGEDAARGTAFGSCGGGARTTFADAAGGARATFADAAGGGAGTALARTSFARTALRMIARRCLAERDRRRELGPLGTALYDAGDDGARTSNARFGGGGGGDGGICGRRRFDRGVAGVCPVLRLTTEYLTDELGYLHCYL